MNPDDNIKPNVFEAMREILPDYEYLSLRNPLIPRPNIPTPLFIIDANPHEESVIGVPISTPSQKILECKINTIKDFDRNYAAVRMQPLYRGESQVYEKQVPGIERNPSNGIHLDDQNVIDNIKIIDFLKFIVTLPEIADINYYKFAFNIEALAQH